MKDVSRIVKSLRVKLGDSQQSFAVRLGLSVRSIANYEAGRVPKTDVLALMAETAYQNEFWQIFNDFVRAYCNQSGAKLTQHANPFGEMALRLGGRIAPTPTSESMIIMSWYLNVAFAYGRETSKASESPKLLWLLERIMLAPAPGRPTATIKDRWLTTDAA
jgi:transcriptional regulator with XRE-family HTH domain